MKTAELLPRKMHVDTHAETHILHTRTHTLITISGIKRCHPWVHGHLPKKLWLDGL